MTTMISPDSHSRTGSCTNHGLYHIFSSFFRTAGKFRNYQTAFLSAAILFSSSTDIYGQKNTTSISFDKKEAYLTSKGNCFISQSGYKGHALGLQSESEARIPLKLEPGFTYRLTAWLKTSSGADHIALATEGLGQYDTGTSSALATWSEVSLTLQIPPESQGSFQLAATVNRTANGQPAFIDEITIQRTGTFATQHYAGIPPRKQRQIKTELGITMQPDKTIEWMLDRRLGMFIHWGLYSGPGRGEWYMENQGISPEKYRELAYPQSGDLYFTARDFDAEKWVNLAQKAGMKYMNMVTQHHDGYALFESKYMNAFTSKQTHNRDFVKEYVNACRKAGLKVGLYKTLINWRFPGYYDVTGTDCKPNRFGYTTKPEHKENARLMKEELYCQVKELMTNYGQIDQLFWDGGWLGQQGTDADAAYFWESGKYLSDDNEWPVNPYFRDKDEQTGQPLGLMGIVRKYQPNIVVNPRSGWCGDYTCEEGTAPVKGKIREGVVEKCISLSSGWGYNKAMENPQYIMPLKQIKRLCADCMVRNMCFLVNIGPDRHGNVPPLIEQRFLEFGEWVKKISEAIYGTRGGPWEPVEGQYGFTFKNNMIYVYFLDGFKSDTFRLPPVDKGMKAIKAYDLCSGSKIRIDNRKNGITLKGLHLSDQELPVIAIEFNRPIYP